MKFLVIGALVAFALWHAHKKARTADDAWQAAGRRTGLRFHGGGAFQTRSLKGRVGESVVRVDTFTRQSGKHRKRYTRYRVAIGPLDLGLKISPQGQFSGVKKLFGAQDIEVGDADFDGAVMIAGKDPREVARFLTPARRALLQRAFSRFRNLRITDTEIRCIHRGTDGEKVVVSTVKGLVAVARGMGSEETPLARAMEAREEARLDDALALAEEAVQDEAEDASEAHLVKSEIFLAARRRAEAAAALAQATDAAGERIAEPEVAALVEELRSEPAVPQPLTAEDPVTSAPEPVLDSAVAVATALFVPGRMSSETREHFEAEFVGRGVRWRGELTRLESYYSDMVFGSGRGTRALVKVHTIEGSGLGSGDVRAVVQLPQEAAEELSGAMGEPVELAGRLVSCDPFMRQLFVADGKVRKR